MVYQAGDGPALVWLHGLYGVDADAPFIEALARHHSVLAPLAPGFADLAELDDLHDIHDLALHYDDVLDALELDQAVVVGHSFGAMIAAELAAHTGPRIAARAPVTARAVERCLPGGGPVGRAAGRDAEDAVCRSVQSSRARAEARRGGRPRAGAGMTSVARFLWPIPDRGLSRRLRRVRAPTLVIHGEQDRFVPVQYAHDFVALLPNASAHIIPGAGHMLPAEALDAVLQAIETRTEVHA